MPLYEYACDACGHRWEVIQKFSDPPLEKCPKCAGAVHKLQSAPAFQFKGSGWYITDYAKKEQPSANKSDGARKDGGEAAAEGSDKKETAKTDKSTEKSSGGDSSSSSTAASPAKDSKSA
jgi:putative FmdB family regulatory protein